MFRLGGVILGCGVGTALGWTASRVFSRPLVQDISATLVGWVLGTVIAVAAELVGVWAA
jgi:NhaP-type Na+/H+ or K+/H+ antiporter